MQVKCSLQLRELRRVCTFYKWHSIKTRLDKIDEKVSEQRVILPQMLSFSLRKSLFQIVLPSLSDLDQIFYYKSNKDERACVAESKGRLSYEKSPPTKENQNQIRPMSLLSS